MKKRLNQILVLSTISLCCTLFSANIVKAEGRSAIGISASTQDSMNNLSQYIISMGKYKKNRAKLLFSDQLDKINRFIENADKNERMAIEVKIGFFKIGNIIFINNSRIKKFMGSSRSTINGNFQKLNYKSESILQLEKEYPQVHELLLDIWTRYDANFRRQWSAKVPIQGAYVPDFNLGTPTIVPAEDHTNEQMSAISQSAAFNIATNPNNRDFFKSPSAPKSPNDIFTCNLENLSSDPFEFIWQQP